MIFNYNLLPPIAKISWKNPNFSVCNSQRINLLHSPSKRLLKLKTVLREYQEKVLTPPLLSAELNQHLRALQLLMTNSLLILSFGKKLSTVISYHNQDWIS